MDRFSVTSSAASCERSSTRICSTPISVCAQAQGTSQVNPISETEALVIANSPRIALILHCFITRHRSSSQKGPCCERGDRDICWMPMKTLSQIILIATLVVFTGFSSAHGADLVTKRALTLETAKSMIAAAEKKAIANHWAMVIAVLDDGGNLFALERMDGAPVGSIEVAQKKANSSFRFKSPTKDFADGLAKGSTALLTLGVVTFEGGIPILL